ncbi:hypothetical protein [Methylotuvimicrobium sp. KM2]|uniref:hypothetical protein n=1 Tax=Methylotuvimicrobium sp. KM2 TaxID=3133976 RepID=UPI003101A51D
MLHPNQFHVNETWIAFQLNEAPIITDRDGDFNIIALMDAASCFILGMGFVKSNTLELSHQEAKKLLKIGYDHKKQYPKEIILPNHMAADVLTLEAKSNGIKIKREAEKMLEIFLGEARESFREHLGQGRMQ